MSDRDASISDAAFREALREARRLFILHHVPHRMEYGNDNQWHRVQNSEMIAELDALLALYAERQGEEYEVAFIQPDCGDPTVPEHAEEWGVGLHGTMPGWLHPGDRVRVTKVEEAQ